MEWKLTGWSPMSADLEAIIMDQMEQIDALQAERAPDYYQCVYDRIFDAWGAFALAELGTRTPSHADLVGRPELAALWEAVR